VYSEEFGGGAFSPHSSQIEQEKLSLEIIYLDSTRDNINSPQTV
jgi:hypothetical protein